MTVPEPVEGSTPPEPVEGSTPPESTGSTPPEPVEGFSFTVGTRLPGRPGRTGTISTPHGPIHTPAFVAVGTKATVKAVLPESLRDLGVQAVLANAYHLYLQPGPEIIDEAGGLARFMNWPGPTFTDSGGFQVMSMGAGFKKVLAMSTAGLGTDDVITSGRKRLAHVDDDGVTFTSHLNGSKHRFTPEVSMQIQHQLGADIMFAFDELTTLMNTREYQVESVQRTHRWAERCLVEHQRLTAERAGKPYQALFGVIQGAQYEDLRRQATRGLESLRVGGPDGDPRGFDGYGIGGALEKENLGTIVGWCAAELPEHKPRHLLGISEPDDVFTAIANGVDTFDCVSPSRVARNSAVYTLTGRFNVSNAGQRRIFEPIEKDCDCYTCAGFTRAYLHHLFKAKEMLAATLCTIHNERFIVRLVDDIRASIEAGTFEGFRDEFLGRYYASKVASSRG
jgi:queuine tRNA-ribosyltransferase